MSEVMINVATEYDGKGLKQADKAFNLLTKKVAKFTSTLYLAHKAQQAMFDAMADEKATKVLAQNLKNLGMAYAVMPAEQFIKQMQRQTGILDDELRPAYATLARVTGDMAITQKTLALAFDISSGTGEDFTSVINALAQAYVGNTRGLRSLNIGLTQAQLQTKSFADLTDILTKQFQGAGAAALETYAGKYAVLKVAANDASEVIGKGFLDAIQTVSGSTGLEDFVNKIDSAAQKLAYFTQLAGASIATIINFVKTPFIGGEKAAAEAKRILEQVKAAQKTYAERNMKVWYPEGFQTPAMKKAAAAALARSKEILANNKKLTAEKNKQLAADKAMEAAKTALGQAGTIFDLERIGIQAAMMNQTLTENERKRLEIKQAMFDLQDAIDSKDTARIDAQTAILNGLVGQFSTMQKQSSLLGQIQGQLNDLGVNKELISILNLQQALDLLKQLNSTMLAPKTITGGGISGALSAANKPPSVSSNEWNSIIGDAANAEAESIVASSSLLAASSAAQTMAMSLIAQKVPVNQALSASRYTGQAMQWWAENQPSLSVAAPTQQPVVINITENAQGLVKVIMDATQDQSANGIPTFVNRNNKALAW